MANSLWKLGHTSLKCITSVTKNPTQSVADIIMPDIQIHPGCYMRDQLLLRILRLKMAGTEVIPSGMLELWAFIILWLEPKHHKQKHALACSRCWLENTPDTCHTVWGELGWNRVALGLKIRARQPSRFKRRPSCPISCFFNQFWDITMCWFIQASLWWAGTSIIRVGKQLSSPCTSGGPVYV